MIDPTTEEVENQSPLEELPAIYNQFRGPCGEPVQLASALLENLDEMNLSRSEILMALELARMETEASETERSSLFLLILASMVAKQRGSVRFDVSRNGGSDGSLAERLRRNLAGITEVLSDQERFVGPDSPDEDSIGDWLASRIQTLLDDPERLDVIGDEEDETPLVLTGNQLYHQRSYTQERRLARFIRERIIPDQQDRIPLEFLPDTERLGEAMEQICAVSEFQLTSKQQYGILTATCALLSVITGGPGTGKTSIVRSLVRYLVELGIDPDEIALAAPTGKAANRLGESISRGLKPEQNETDQRIANEFESPSTLHRLLGYSQEWESFYYHENRPLPHRYVIVDEASMIDLALMEQLLSATAESSALCLLGDADQLPAVESGAVFRDLVPTRENTDVPWQPLAPDPFPGDSSGTDDPLSGQAVRLDQNFRVSGGDPSTVNLVSVAEIINQGGDELTFANSADSPSSDNVITVQDRFEDLSFRGVELLASTDSNQEQKRGEGRSSRPFTDLLRNWYDRWMKEELYEVLSTKGALPEESFRFQHGRPEGCSDELDRLFEAYTRAQLLSVTRRTPRGVRTMNRILHRYHRRSWDSLGSGSRRDFLPGEPIIMMRNDYDRQLFNGEQGLVLSVDQPGKNESIPMAVFPGVDGYRAYHLGPLQSELNHAFALTVHKSQGSEYGSVGIILPEREVPLMTKELLYTAVTRARESVTFFGEREMIKKGSEKQDERNSGLLERLE